MNVEATPLSVALAGRRSDLVRKWFERILQTYPESTTKFLLQEKDGFRNPVGHTLREGLSTLFDGLIQSSNVASLAPSLESIVRIRAVQDFSASQAIAFPFLLKQIIRDECATDILRHSDAFAALEDRIDELALLAFDLFVKCREQVYEIKVKEIQRRSFMLERAYQKRASSS